jgi:hypothetical protein
MCAVTSENPVLQNAETALRDQQSFMSADIFQKMADNWKTVHAKGATNNIYRKHPEHLTNHYKNGRNIKVERMTYKMPMLNQLAVLLSMYRCPYQLDIPMLNGKQYGKILMWHEATRQQGKTVKLQHTNIWIP